jgi:two-component system, chemotaxis family, protein-glutamate methylesterase/glutaminase
MKAEAIVIGVSWGGMQALKKILPSFPKDFLLPVIIVQHLDANSDTSWIDILDSMSNITVKEADEKEKISPGIAYIAPANYHLMIEKDKTFSLSVEERVNFSRPSIDILFECASEVYEKKLIGVVLTGLNSDGASGLRQIKQKGGITIVEDPTSAEAGEMPRAAIAATKVDYVLPLPEIITILLHAEQHI